MDVLMGASDAWLGATMPLRGILPFARYVPGSSSPPRATSVLWSACEYAPRDTPQTTDLTPPLHPSIAKYVKDANL